MSRKFAANLVVAALCLSFSAGSASAQFNLGGKLGSISKKAGSQISRSKKSFPKPKFKLPSPSKGIGSVKPKLPVKLPKPGFGLPKPKPITLPKPGFGLPKPKPITLPKPGFGLPKPKPITLPKPGFGLPKPKPITLPKPPIRFPRPGIGPIPGKGPIVPPNPIVKPLPKPGPGPIVPPNPEITPLPEPIKNPHPDHCWKPPHRRCHWWINLCAPIRTCRPADVVRCDWNYVQCPTVVAGNHVINSRWYLGVEGVFLPGKGLGIEAVQEGSPAALAGLTSGIVIIEANGISMESEEAMQQAIAQSHGILHVIVLSEASEQPLQTTVQMIRLASASF